MIKEQRSFSWQDSTSADRFKTHLPDGLPETHTGSDQTMTERVTEDGQAGAPRRANKLVHLGSWPS